MLCVTNCVFRSKILALQPSADLRLSPVASVDSRSTYSPWTPLTARAHARRERSRVVLVQRTQAAALEFSQAWDSSNARRCSTRTPYARLAHLTTSAYSYASLSTNRNERSPIFARDTAASPRSSLPCLARER